MEHRFVIYLLVMAGVTYLIRLLPIAIFQKPIHNTFIRSFLFYVPYAVLAAMTFPAIFTSTQSVPAAIVGVICALYLSYREKSLITVAVLACLAVFCAQWVINLL